MLLKQLPANETFTVSLSFSKDVQSYCFVGSFSKHWSVCLFFPRFLTENISLIDASLIGSMAVLMHNQFHRDFTNLADNPCLLLLSGCRQLSYCEYCMGKFS